MTTIDPTTPTKAPEINAENTPLIETLEHLSSAWTTCGEALDPACGVLSRWQDLERDGEFDDDTMRCTAESICPGLLAAAEVYGAHVEAGWPYAFDEQRIRALFTTHMGRDPFGQPSPEPA